MTDKKTFFALYLGLPIMGPDNDIVDLNKVDEESYLNLKDFKLLTDSEAIQLSKFYGWLHANENPSVFTNDYLEKVVVTSNNIKYGRVVLKKDYMGPSHVDWLRRNMYSFKWFNHTESELIKKGWVNLITE